MPSPLLTSHCPHSTHQSGTGTSGFLLLALPILLLGLGGIDLAHGLFVRQTLSHALIQAGRAATVDHARPDTLAQAFEQALHPLFLRPGSLQSALAQRHHETGRAPWQIRIIQPKRAAFTEHADPGIQVPGLPSGRRAINHDYQALQHQRLLNTGWQQGKGPASGQTVFEANTLMLELIWPHESLMPGIKALIRALGPADDSYRSRLMAHGYLPMLRSVSLSMQSHPADWPDRSDGKVIHGEASEIPTGPNASCTGFWGSCSTSTVSPLRDKQLEPTKPGSRSRDGDGDGDEIVSGTDEGRGEGSELPSDHGDPTTLCND